MYRLTQAILKPEETLIPGRKYTLKIDHLDEEDIPLLDRWNSKTQKHEPIAWEVVAGIDTSVPKFLNLPELVDKRTIHYSCGPATYADFNMQIEDASGWLIKTELVDLENGESNIFYLHMDGLSILSVGHGMCTGAFNYKLNGQYKIRFSLMDICGNENNQWTDWIEFDSPFKQE